MTARPAEGAPRRAHLRRLAWQLQADVAAGRLTDLEALARLAEQRAATAADTRLAERWRFVQDLVSVLTEWEITRWPPRRRPDYVPFGERGFAPAYHSLDRGSTNQVRHLVAFLLVGFAGPRLVTYPLAVIIECVAAIVRRRPVDWPDVRLSLRGLALGAAIRAGRLPLSRAGAWLRSTLGDATPAAGR